MSANQVIGIYSTKHTEQRTPAVHSLRKLAPPLIRYAKKYWAKRKQKKRQQAAGGGGPPPQPGAGAYQQQPQQYHQQAFYQQQGPYPPPPPQQPPYGGAAGWNQGGGQSKHDDPNLAQLRNQANNEGDMMAEAFDAASTAYDRGDGAKAKELSNQGHEHQRKMHELNEQAADWIFKENNKELPPGEVDLHGLYVQEAIERADSCIDKAKREGLDEIRLIVGKGNHSKQHIAKIKPAIVDLMEKHDLDADLDPHNSGVLVVQLKPVAPKASRNAHALAEKVNKDDGGDCIVM